MASPMDSSSSVFVVLATRFAHWKDGVCAFAYEASKTAKAIPTAAGRHFVFMVVSVGVLTNPMRIRRTTQTQRPGPREASTGTRTLQPGSLQYFDTPTQALWILLYH